MIDVILYESGAALAYCGVGIALMAVGYVLVDILTPGKLGELIWQQRNRNASTLLASNILGVSIIIVSAIFASEDSLGAGLLSTVIYGLIGLVVMGIAFVLLDAITPGKLGHILAEDQPHPAVWVSASVHLAVGLVVSAALI